MRNVRLDEGHARVKMVRRNINSLRYADDNGRNGRGTKNPLDKGERRK